MVEPADWVMPRPRSTTLPVVAVMLRVPTARAPTPVRMSTPVAVTSPVRAMPVTRPLAWMVRAPPRVTPPSSSMMLELSPTLMVVVDATFRVLMLMVSL